MSKPLVTILMPVYNAERFLREAVDSILNQTLNNFEFLIIDDGSSDSSLEIIRSYSDPRIRLIQNEKNIGISTTLNKGINLASADFIARMDADDISYPERLQKQYDYLKTHPDCALLSTQARIITEDGQEKYIDDTDGNYYYYILTFSSPIFHSSVMYRKDAVLDVGMYSAPYSEDFELFWQLTRKYKLYNLPEVLLDYRNHSASLHLVNKKTEYSDAAYNQALRNLRFYAGDNYMISEDCVKCFQYNFEPILRRKNIKSIVDCIHKLDFITDRILAADNVNRDIKNIKEAALYKRRLMVSLLLEKLPLSKAVLLSLKLREYKNLMNKMKNFLKKRMKVLLFL
jgi:glycosyltransferase involved in cell wall biosynthesis